MIKNTNLLWCIKLDQVLNKSNSILMQTNSMECSAFKRQLNYIWNGLASSSWKASFLLKKSYSNKKKILLEKPLKGALLGYWQNSYNNNFSFYPKILDQ